jgi:hypothetical protein
LFLQQLIPCSTAIVLGLQRAVQLVAEHIVNQAEEEREEAKHTTCLLVFLWVLLLLQVMPPMQERQDCPVPKEGARSFLQQSIPCSAAVVMRLQRTVQPVAEHIVKQAEEEREEAKHKRAELQMRNPPRTDSQMGFVHAALSDFGNEVPQPRRLIAELRDRRRQMQQQQQQQQQQPQPQQALQPQAPGGSQQGAPGADWRGAPPMEGMGGNRDSLMQHAELPGVEKAGPPAGGAAAAQV